ncbi:MAG TPA: hypothetical protein VJQ82_27705, partial [Terriglobales bacterium]|nr:hypothetical protein [Terriglobales bacterium]
MTTAASWSSALRDRYMEESARIAREFATNGDGRAAITQRTVLVENVLRDLWRECISPEEKASRGFSIAALGGFGRGWLFPHSDIDLLFLYADRGTEEQFRNQTRQFSQALWDLRLKFSPATRLVSDCGRFDPANVEFAISLLDCRPLAGDAELFAQLHERVLPKLVASETKAMVQSLAEVTRRRFEKYGNTVFHLEPNVKDTPGGLRDCNVALWLSLVSSMEQLQDWPDAKSLLPASVRKPFDSALEFLMSVRCFLHLRYRRDDNSLSWEAQEEAAKRGIGIPDGQQLTAAEWMRVYFRHARATHRTATQLLEEIPAAWSSLYRQFNSWKARVSNADFSVVDGLVFLRQSSSLQDPEMLLRLFHFVAHHGLRLSTTTEYRVEQVLPALAATPPRGAELWLYLS